MSYRAPCQGWPSRGCVDKEAPEKMNGTHPGAHCLLVVWVVVVGVVPRRRLPVVVGMRVCLSVCALAHDCQLDQLVNHEPKAPPFPSCLLSFRHGTGLAVHAAPHACHSTTGAGHAWHMTASARALTEQKHRRLFAVPPLSQHSLTLVATGRGGRGLCLVVLVVLPVVHGAVDAGLDLGLLDRALELRGQATSSSMRSNTHQHRACQTPASLPCQGLLCTTPPPPTRCSRLVRSLTASWKASAWASLNAAKRATTLTERRWRQTAKCQGPPSPGLTALPWLLCLTSCRGRSPPPARTCTGHRSPCSPARNDRSPPSIRAR